MPIIGASPPRKTDSRYSAFSANRFRPVQCSSLEILGREVFTKYFAFQFISEMKTFHTFCIFIRVKQLRSNTQYRLGNEEKYNIRRYTVLLYTLGNRTMQIFYRAKLHHIQTTLYASGPDSLLGSVAGQFSPTPGEQDWIFAWAELHYRKQDRIFD